MNTANTDPLDLKNKNNKYDNLINPIVVKNIKNGSKIFDIGCWDGSLGKYLINNKNCIVDGVDFIDQVLEKAKSNGYKKVYKINLNCEVEKLNGIDFSEYDYIICADVLEHLIDADRILKIINSKINKDSKLLISIPNIAFLKYRILHLLGNFNYTNTGVMDNTHLKFYTYDSIVKLLNENNFKILKITAYTLASSYFWFVDYLAKVFPKMFGLQFFIECKKKD